MSALEFLIKAESRKCLHSDSTRKADVKMKSRRIVLTSERDDI